MTNLLIFGAGYSAREAAVQSRADYSRIAGTFRKAEHSPGLAASGIEPAAFTETRELEAILAESDHILVSIPPDAKGDPVLAQFAPAMRRSASLSWICYLSTVGVYGDHGGAWVSEKSDCRPGLARSRWRLDAERAWQETAASMEIPLAIFRISGIYGPGRNAFINIERGTSRRIVKPGQVFNRVHRDDIAAAFVLAARRQANGIFNISDDLPAPPQDVVTCAHGLHGSEPPPEIDFDNAPMSDMAKSFYGECKRVDNTRSRSVLGMTYAWPDYRTALARMWEEGSWRAD
jgi:nucleoside-diphosphate-sugar epimerase